MSTGNGADTAPLEPNIEDICRHHAALFPTSRVHGYPDAKVELAYGLPKPTMAEGFSAFDVEGFAKRAVELNRQGYSCYIGAALRRPEWPGTERSDGKDTLVAFSLFADYEHETGDADLSEGATAFDLNPAFMVTTGEIPHPRRHAYVLTIEDIEPDQIKAGAAALQRVYNSDPGVISADRVLRLGGTINRPDPKKRANGRVNELTAFSVVRGARSHRIADIIALKPSEQASGANGAAGDADLGGEEQKAAKSPEELLALLAKARTINPDGSGNWNSCMLDILGSLVGRRETDFAIKMICAQSCDGGYDDPELEAFLQRTRVSFDMPDPTSFATAPPVERPWPTLDRTAMYGIIGDIVRAVEPHTEADPAGILFTLFAQCGSLIGPLPYCKVDIASQLRLNMFCMLVGKTSKARKGTVGELVKYILRGIDDEWSTTRQLSGLSTGEGVIHAARDEEKKWNKDAQDFEIIDPGIKDKRLMVTESEFARPLMAMERSGNTLSPILRDAWDCATLRTSTRSNGQIATNPFISLVAHITEAELSRRMTQTELANGFANRFMFCSVRRSKLLPRGGGDINEEALAALNVRLKEAIAYAKRLGRIRLNTAAEQMWEQIYPKVSSDRPGLLGSVLARAEAHVMKLTSLFTALDMTGTADVPHLEAGLAAWGYSEGSCKYIFGSASGDAVADEILRALLHRGKAGMSRTAIRDTFQRNVHSGRIATALNLLRANGQARCDISRKDRGAPVEMWYAVEIDEK
jgi:hypothetical protein